VRTRAVRQGDVYVLNGEKRWTSGGHRADYLWVLCRTGTIESHSRGLTLLIVDRRSPGISIAPIPSLDGERFNEIRFDDVEVPVANRVGDEDGAWTMMVESLATERHVQFSPKRVQRDFEQLVELVERTGRAADPIVRTSIAELAVELAEVEALSLLMLAAIQRGDAGVVEAACNKLAGSEVAQRIARAGVDLCGTDALERGTPMEFLWRQSVSETIGGGTSEVMRGLVARVALGLGARR
jgi:3-oxocholest-4-en-26-oyl-CoA dehydrogenase alpha subunit